MQIFSHRFTTRHYLTALLLLSMLIAGCGFKIRGQVDLPFKSIYTNITRQSNFGVYIYRLLKASSPSTIILNSAANAELIVTQLDMRRLQTEVSLDADGKVEEYELGLLFQFSVSDAQGNELIPPTTLSSTQLLPYDENAADAKSAEIQLIYTAMEKNIADRLYRRLTSEELIKRYRHFNSQ